MTSSAPSPRKDFQKAVQAFCLAGGRIYRDGDRALVSAPPGVEIPAELVIPGAIEAVIMPKVSAEEAATVRAILADLGGKVHVLTDEAAARDAIQVLLQTPVAKKERLPLLGFDTETAIGSEWRAPILVPFTTKGEPHKRPPKDGIAGYALDPYRSEVRLVQLFGRREDGVFIFDLRAIGSAAAWNILRPALTGTKLVAVNAVFDCVRLLQAGIVPAAISDPLRTVALTHGLVAEGGRVALDVVARRVLGLRLPKELGRSDWGRTTLSPEQIAYAALDSVLALHLYTTLEKRLSPAERRVRRLVDACIVPTAKMDLAGMPIDSALHAEMLEGWRHLLPEAEADLLEATGGLDLTKPAPLQEHLKRVVTGDRLIHWPRTESGKGLSSRRALLLANQDLPAIPELLTYRRLAKFNESFGEGLKARIHEVTGRVHAHFNLAATKTGRYSSSNPNLQQMPKRDAFRNIFKAPPCHAILSFDYSQIELRILGQVITRFQNGRLSTFDRLFAEGREDVHEGTARMLLGINDPAIKVTKEQRAIGKTANFSLCYGMGEKAFHARRLAENSNASFAESRTIRESWRVAFPDVVHWQSEYAALCERRGQTETMGGRRWLWMWNRMASAVAADEETAEDIAPDSGFRYCFSLNFPVQGAGAELLQRAIFRIDRALGAAGVATRMIACVHDELLFEAPVSEVTEAAELIRATMKAAWLAQFPDAPSAGLVEAGAGPSWGELDKI